MSLGGANAETRAARLAQERREKELRVEKAKEDALGLRELELKRQQRSGLLSLFSNGLAGFNSGGKNTLGK